MTYARGNKADKKHYWLTPQDLFDKLNKEFEFDFDPCPYPQPDDFDDLQAEWGESNYVNPPFNGPTAWVKKVIKEFKKGKRIVFVFPIDKWVFMMLNAGAVIRNLKDIHWNAIEDNSEGPGTGRHVACFILDPENFKKKGTEKLQSPYQLPKIKTDTQKKLFQ